jgi:hypothetical protein
MNSSINSASEIKFNPTRVREVVCMIIAHGIFPSSTKISTCPKCDNESALVHFSTQINAHSACKSLQDNINCFCTMG